MYFCTSVYFKASQETIPTDPDKISYNTVGVETGVGNSKTFLAYDYMLLLNYLGSLAVPRKVVSNWMGVLISKERNNVIVLNTKAIVKSSQWKAIFRATTRLPNYLLFIWFTNYNRTEIANIKLYHVNIQAFAQI